MRRVIKADIFRLKRNKMTYILLAALVIFSLISLGSFALLDLSMRYMDAEILGAETVALLEQTVPNTVDKYIETFFFGNFLIVFFVLFALILCSAEYSTGYIKNTAVNILPRHLSFFSKLIIVAVYALISYVVVLLLVLGGCALLKVKEVVNLGGIIKMLIVQFLNNLSLTAFIMMIFYLTRKLPISMIIGLIYAAMGNLLYVLLSLLTTVAFPKSDFAFSQYTNLGNMTFHINTQASTTDYIRAVIVAIVFLGISIFFSCRSIDKKDIK